MSKGRKGKKNRREYNPVKIGTSLGFTADELEAIQDCWGPEGLRTILDCSKIASSAGYDKEYVIEQLGIHGIEALKKIFPPPRRGAWGYAEQHNDALLLNAYDSIIHMSGWAPIKARDVGEDSDGQAVYFDKDLGLIVALDGKYGRGVIIAQNSRAPFEVMDPRKWRPSDDEEEEPPPYGWRIGMFEGDRVNKSLVTPIMVVSDEVGTTVRRIKDSLDWTLLKTSFVGQGDWQVFPGEFPAVGAPDLSEVEDPTIRERLTIGLSRDGFLNKASSQKGKKGKPSSLLSEIIRQRMGM